MKKLIIAILLFSSVLSAQTTYHPVNLHVTDSIKVGMSPNSAWFTNLFVESLKMTNLGTDYTLDGVGHGDTVTYDTTNVYVSVNAPGGEPGTHPDSAFTLAEVQASIRYPGDSIFVLPGVFRLSSTWDIDWIGEDGDPIVIIKYEPTSPRFLGSVQASTWTLRSGNIWWHYNAALNAFPNGRVYYETADTVIWGIVETSVGALNTNYEYFFANDTVYVYFPSSPATAFTSVEVNQLTNLIEFQTGADSCEYITLDGLEVAYGSDVLIRSEYPGGITGQTRKLRGIEIRNSHVHHCGIKDGNAMGIEVLHSDVIIEDNELNDAGRRNISIVPDNSFNSDDGISNIIIQDNYIHSGWHTTALDIINLNSSITIEDVDFIRNFVNDFNTPITAINTLSIQIHIDVQGAETGVIRDVNIENNIFVNPKSSALRIEHVDSTNIISNTFSGVNDDAANFEAYIRALDSYSTSNRVVIKNNVFDGDKDSYYMISTAEHNVTDWDVDYNLYYSTSVGDVFQENNTKYNLSEFAGWQTDTGFDGNSPTPADPDLNASFTYPFTYDDWRPNVGSPAINAGVDILTGDYYETTRNDPPELGAVEIQ